MDETELQLKKIIIDKYGSLKKFCEKIDMPWTTLDSILKRGVTNSNITNVMKITRELQVDTESLASGLIVNSQSIKEVTIKKNLTTLMPKILEYYEQLNDTGKHVATERVKELTEVARYVMEENNYVNAAHADDYSNAPDELKQQEEDIMDDENF